MFWFGEGFKRFSFSVSSLLYKSFRLPYIKIIAPATSLVNDFWCLGQVQAIFDVAIVLNNDFEVDKRIEIVNAGCKAFREIWLLFKL